MAKAKRRSAQAPSRRRASEPPNPWTNVDREGKNLHIGHFLTFQIIRLANAAKSNVTRQYLAEFGLSVPEWRLLAMSVRFEPVRFSELVANSNMDKGQASRTLHSLSKRGLISSQAAGGGARRSAESGAPIILTVTPKGHKVYRTCLPVAQRNQAQLLRLLTREERKLLYVVLNKLFAAIGDLDVLA
ncbi:MAG TPA: MarR family winged helix-turn-helix transcriptional regulator [Steroidobacteraceae bacterium]|nr:MarR family winged helix-turn-helix transcriptional regulator [Steroidobacteraceae bacterium]